MSNVKTMNKKNESGPNIFLAKNYRAFLKDLYLHKKSVNKKFSYTLYSRSLGFASRSFIQHLITGRKNISLESLDQFRKLFPRQPYKFEYFRKLVLRDQAKTAAEKKYYESQIRYDQKQQQIHEMNIKEYDLYSDWYFVPIFFLAYYSEFEPNFEWIHKRLAFSVSKAEVNKAIILLFKHGYWKQTPKGVQPLKPGVNSHAELDRSKLKRFHQRMLELAREASELPFEQRIITGSTFMLTDLELKEIREKLFRFKQMELAPYQINDPENYADTKKFYQLEWTIFPLSTICSI